MHTRATSNGHRGLAGAVKAVSERVSTLVRLELELAALELKQKLSAIGVGLGLAAGAAVFAVFAFGFLFATIAAGLATFLATWLALLIVTAGLVVLAALFGVLAGWKIKRGTPPVPEQAIREARLTTEALRH